MRKHRVLIKLPSEYLRLIKLEKLIAAKNNDKIACLVTTVHGSYTSTDHGGSTDYKIGLRPWTDNSIGHRWHGAPSYGLDEQYDVGRITSGGGQRFETLIAVIICFVFLSIFLSRCPRYK